MTMRLTITEIRVPLGQGPGTVFARNVNAQAVKIAVNASDWQAFADAGLTLGDDAIYDPIARTWKRS